MRENGTNDEKKIRTKIMNGDNREIYAIFKNLIVVKNNVHC